MMKKYYAKNVIATAIAANFLLSATFANAETHEMENMHDHGDNPIVAKVMFDQLELRGADGENSGVIEAQAWIGKDLNKLWLKADLEKHDGEIQNSEIQALYSHAISTYWDLQVGLREDIKPSPARTWGVLGVQGLAPYFFDVDIALFVSDAGRIAARASVEYDLLFTQKLILSPALEINIYGQNDAETDTGAGISNINTGLRLRYEIRREFAPYIGINWDKKFGVSADFARATKTSVSNTELVIGLRTWF